MLRRGQKQPAAAAAHSTVIPFSTALPTSSVIHTIGLIIICTPTKKYYWFVFLRQLKIWKSLLSYLQVFLPYI